MTALPYLRQPVNHHPIPNGRETGLTRLHDKQACLKHSHLFTALADYFV